MLSMLGSKEIIFPSIVNFTYFLFYLSAFLPKAGKPGLTSVGV